jgi:hypothetical protein
MNIDDRIEELKKAVQAAEDEASMAVMFHETWKPTAYDVELQERMGTSFATHSFQIVRWSLRREMMLALMRLWDTNKEAIRMTAIAETLRDEQFFSALVDQRVSRMQLRSLGVRDALMESMVPTRDAVLSLVRRYCQDGAGHEVIKKIRVLRHERLAHRQIEAASAPRPDVTDEEVEAFYADSLELVRLLLTLVLARAFDLSEAANVYRHHAKFFWAGARGERTEGHPNYWAPEQVLTDL